MPCRRFAGRGGIAAGGASSLSLRSRGARLEQQAGGDGGAHEAEGLDESCAGAGRLVTSSSAVSRPTVRAAGRRDDHFSRVRWASIPVNPPAAT